MRNAIVLAIVAVIASGLARAKHCEYGSIPGHIVVSTTNVFPLQWEQLDPDCIMTNELNKYLGLDPTGQAAVQDRDISFLMYGDASDGFMAKDVCELGAQTGVDPTSGSNGQSPYCLLKGLQLVSQLIPGVSPQGPYAQGFTDADAPSKSIPQGLAKFKELTSKSKPDVVVFSSLLQDVRRMLEHNKQDMSEEFLSKQLVETWIEQTKAQLTSLESQYDNDTLLIFHGAVYPQLVDCKMGGEHANAMGKRTHIIQLNKAAVHVMQERPRWHLVDYDQMSMPFSLTGIHLRDGIHAGQAFLAQVLNVYLNLYKQHLKESGQKPLPEPSMAVTQPPPAYTQQQQVVVTAADLLPQQSVGSIPHTQHTLQGHNQQLSGVLPAIGRRM